MENVIYYFSGRGNSLAVARGLARRMGGTAVKPMAAGEAALPGGRVGLVLPVVDIGIPAFVRRFIAGLRVSGSAPYVYAVITCGGMPGASMLQVKKLLCRRGLSLSAGWTVTFGLEPKSDAEWDALLDGISAAVSGKATLPLPPVDLGARLLTGLANPLARRFIPGEDRKFRVDGACTGCGTCARVCPARNISLAAGRPVWHHRCEQCAACFGWCPQLAISGTNLAARARYTNPRVTLDDMMTGEAR
jgi:ferredoxin